MYPIHDYHLYFSSAGAQADVDSLYYTIGRRPVDVSFVNLLIEKGESKYSTGSNELFVLGGVCIGVCVCARVLCVCAHVCVRVCIHMNCKLLNSLLRLWVHMCMLEVHVCPDSHPNSLVQAFSYSNQSVVTITVTMVFMHLYSLSGFFR